MSRERADITQRMLFRQMDQGFPERQILLVQLLPGVLDRDAILACQGDFLEKLAIFALNCREERRANEAIGRGPAWPRAIKAIE